MRLIFKSVGIMPNFIEMQFLNKLPRMQFVDFGRVVQSWI